jgi:hypothetical protein
MFFFDSPEAVCQAARDDQVLLGQLPVVERAWESLDLDGVLFSHGRPLLYLKESSRPFEFHERIRLHRLFWNQGVANVLVLADPSNVYVYSALAWPEKEGTTQERALVETLECAAYAQSTKAFFTSLDTGLYYQEHKDRFQPDATVDEYLLEQLNELCDKLTGEDPRLPKAMAHGLLGRLLFVCYLLDREIVTLADAKDNRRKGAARLAARIEQAEFFKAQRDFLYDWFAELKVQFNGTMFDQDLDQERAAIRDVHIRAVADFLGGHETAGQRTLGFWAYDFQMIPVETISAIYESFLAGDDPRAKREGGAFYTPRFLAEMVLDVASEGAGDITAKRCLDPACGSGIFLVILFSRMASAWLAGQPGKPSYAAKVKAFKSILSERIRGLDKDETACRIACFSLYLAYLDRLDPPDIQAYARKTGKALPRLLDDAARGTGTDENLIPVIRRADTLAEPLGLDGEFDIVVGNPPWRERPNQLAQRFTEKAPEFLRSGGTGCLLLPTALLLNKTDDFQARWLRRITLERVVNLADYRLLLFKNAKRPALIARFRNEPPRLGTATIEHDAPKFRRDSLREGCITISPQDRSWIPLRNILAAAQEENAPLLWKRYLWGTPRDQKLLDLLLDMPTLSEIASQRNWARGEGFQPDYTPKASIAETAKSTKRCPWRMDMPFLDARQPFDLCVLPHDCTTVGARLRSIGASTSSLRRLPDKRLFVPPMVLVSKGFGKVAFCDFPVTFQHAVRSFAASSQDEELLMFLAVYLRSPLARYFLFHTAGNWGTERDEVQFDELLRLPFPLPGTEYASAKAQSIVQDVAKRVRAFRERIDRLLYPRDHLLGHQPAPEKRREMTDAIQGELNAMVYAYFGLTQQEIVLLEDTTEIVEPSSTPHAWWSTENVFTLDPIQEPRPVAYKDGLGVYAATLTETLNGWAEETGSTHRVCATGGCDDCTGLAMITLRLAKAEAPFHQTDVSRGIWDALNGYRRQASRRKQGALAGERDIFLFDDDEISIVRPGILGNWTRTAALNDAARIYGEIALSAEGR